jgi:uncharacterized membrane protein
VLSTVSSSRGGPHLRLHQRMIVPGARHARRAGTAGQGPGPARTTAPAAHTRSMGRIIGTILGAILAIWLAVTVAGGIFATFKMFLIIALIAMAVFVVVWLVARHSRRG